MLFSRLFGGSHSASASVPPSHEHSNYYHDTVVRDSDDGIYRHDDDYEDREWDDGAQSDGYDDGFDDDRFDDDYADYDDHDDFDGYDDYDGDFGGDDY